MIAAIAAAGMPPVVPSAGPRSDEPDTAPTLIAPPTSESQRGPTSNESPRLHPVGPTDARRGATITSSVPTALPGPTPQEIETTHVVGTTEGTARGAKLAKLATVYAAHVAAVHEQHPERFLAPTLAPLSQDQVDAFTNKYAKLVVWENDMRCYARAPVGALELNTNLDSNLADDSIPAGVALVERPARWSYHAAAVVQVEGAAEPHVFDFILDDEPMPLSAWAGKLGVDPATITITSPYVDAKGMTDNDPETSIASASTTRATQKWISSTLGSAVNAWEGVRRIGSGDKATVQT